MLAPMLHWCFRSMQAKNPMSTLFMFYFFVYSRCEFRRDFVCVLVQLMLAARGEAASVTSWLAKAAQGSLVEAPKGISVLACACLGVDALAMRSGLRSQRSAG